MLSDGRDNGEAVELIARNGDLLAESGSVLAAIERDAARPAGPQGVRNIIGRRFVTYPQPDRSEGEWAAWWADYCDVLAKVPGEVLEEAMKAWVRSTAEFLPKPGLLLELCEQVTGPSRLAALRIRAAQRWSPPPPIPAVSPPVDEKAEAERKRSNAAEIRKMAAEFRKAMPETPKRPARPPVSARVDETGVSPQLRELVERQRHAR